MKENGSPEGNICSPIAREGEMKGGAVGEGGREEGRGLEGSISNFSAELTVDGFPIRLGDNTKV